MLLELQVKLELDVELVAETDIPAFVRLIDMFAPFVAHEPVRLPVDVDAGAAVVVAAAGAVVEVVVPPPPPVPPAAAVVDGEVAPLPLLPLPLVPPGAAPAAAFGAVVFVDPSLVAP